MPLPFILLGAAAAAVGAGAKKAYDGHKDKNEADQIIHIAVESYKKEKKHLDQLNDIVSMSLERLGNLELQIGQDFEKFDLLVQEILENSTFQKYSNTKINIPKHKLDQIKEVAITATGYMKTVVGGGVSGAAAGFAVYGGVMALGAASTGTSISALSGVAAYNATMAAIGGGSLAAGGWGMAGGAMVLGAAVIAPVLAVGGIAYGLHGAKALKKAQEIRVEVNDAIKKMHLAEKQLSSVQNYSSRITLELEQIYKIFNEYFDKLKAINEVIKKGNTEEISNISKETALYIQNGMSLAAIMAKIISTPLFKLKTNVDGKIFTDKNGAPEISTDSNGLQILDKVGLDEMLAQSKDETKTFTN